MGMCGCWKKYSIIKEQLGISPIVFTIVEQIKSFISIGDLGVK